MDHETVKSGTTAVPPDGARGTVFDRRLLFLVFFFAAYFYLLYQFARILSPFVAPLVGAMMLTLIFHPLHVQIVKHVKQESAAAAITTVLVLVTIVVPIIMLVWVLVKETAAVVPLIRDWLAEQRELASVTGGLKLPAPIEAIWDTLQRYIERWRVDLRAITVEALREMGNTVTSFGAATVKQFLGLLLDLIVLVLTLFFLFRDGTRVVRWVIDLVPMEESNKQLILGRLDRTLSAIIRGAFITASAQGALTGVGLAVAGVPFPVLLGFAAALLAVVPFVGASLVWVPAAAYLFIKGQTVAGVGLAIWGALVVGLIDNFLRPYVVGEHAQLPILLLLVGILGGIQVYGLIGALVAPLIIASVLAFAQIYREQYVLDRSDGGVAVKSSTGD